jgi:hypothetical protein
VCLEAVKRHGLALQFSQIKTLEICEEAVKNNSIALKDKDLRILIKNNNLFIIIL